MQIAGFGSSTITVPATSIPTQTAASGAASGTAAGSASAASPEATLLAYLNMTPAQKMKFDIMSQMGVTQDDYNRMTPQQQDALNVKIQQKMKEDIQQGTENKTGLIVDVKT